MVRDPTDYLETALRVWTEMLDETRERRYVDQSAALLSDCLLVLDTETTTDAAQSITFGSYRYYRLHWIGWRPLLSCVEEGLFYADDLRERDPEGYWNLRTYAARRDASTEEGMPRRLRFLSRTEFVNTVLFQEAFKKRSLIVGFNLPFDLSRLAVSWGAARGRFQGGISLALFTYKAGGTWKESRFRPRIAIKQIDSKRALKGFTRPAALDDIDRIPVGQEGGMPQEGYMFRGHFLDLRTLVFALTDRGHSLASACQIYGVEAAKLRIERHGEITPQYIDYNRRDVEATAGLFVRVMDDYAQHPIRLQPTKAYSPASIGKAYLRAMGIEPPLKRQPDFPPDVLGYAMVAYYGGRAECRIRKVPLPVVYLDFLSMYPTVNALMRLWDFHIAERIEVEDQTEEIRKFLEDVSLEECFQQTVWRRLPILVELEPKADILPVRARYDPATPSWQIGINMLESGPRWYALADVVASKLLTGRIPRIRRALALAPRGVQAGLREVPLRGEIPVDPLRQDLFKTAIEQRKRIAMWLDLAPTDTARLDRFLKVFANATSYGITAELNRRELPKGKTEKVRVYGLDGPFETRTAAPEEAGEFCFPPFAACITAGARLMLAMLEQCVSDLGGGHVFCDTDSMAIVATEHGDLIPCPGGRRFSTDGVECVRALSWDQVEEIRERFAQLNPYDRTLVPGSVLKVEKENLDPESVEHRQLWCYAVSAKRYALYNLTEAGEPILRKWSEHGLGHLLNPTDPDSEDRDWIRVCWEMLVRRAHKLPVEEPRWLGRPALTRITASSPHILRPFARYNAQSRYEDQVKPFNFLLSAQVAPFGHPEGVDPTSFHLVAPWSSNPEEWLELPWFDLYSGTEFRLTTSDDFGASGQVLVKTYRDVLASYEMHLEAKSRGVG
jgi:hypothetical protein